jgi:xanthine dehydrogenase accessory factor
MRELLPTYDQWRAEGLDVGRAVVVRTYGSAPRLEGAALLVAEDGRLIGSVSGGCVEGAAAEAVQEARASGRSRVIRYGISDEQAWDVGLACGGTIDVLVEPRVPEAVVEAARNEDPPGLAVVAELPIDTPAPFRPTEPFAAPGSDVDEALARASAEALDSGRSRTVEVGERAYFVEAYPARPRLVVVGATEITRFLVGFARDLGYETIVIDARPAFATAERFPDVDRLIVAWPDEAFDEIGLGRSDAVAILSHDPKFDEPAIREAFGRGARYVGAVGSKKTQADRREHLREAGLTDEELARLHGPIGLDLGGREPVETALAIMAEVVAARRGGSGRPLVERGSRGEAPATA